MTVTRMSDDLVAETGPAGLDPAAPLGLVIDDNPGTRRLVTTELRNVGITSEELASVSEIGAVLARRRPDIVFVDVGFGRRAGVDAVRSLAQAGVDCPVQLMSGLNMVLIEDVRRAGEMSGMTMLPVLTKPFRDSAVRRVVEALGLRRDAAAQLDVSLAEVIQEGWLELWYQPKIDLRTRVFAGAEAYARARHPQHGVLTPEAFLTHASDDDLLLLTEHVLKAVLADWDLFARSGISIRFAINVPVTALVDLPLNAIIMAERPKAANWPGLVLEVSEEEIVPNLAVAQRLSYELGAYNVGLAIDDFGSTYSALAHATKLPFCEMKIDRSYVSRCDSDEANSGLCGTIIAMAHRFGITAVAEGIETTAELEVLRDMGCDYGQGYFLARPLPKPEFAALLLSRGRTRRARL